MKSLSHVRLFATPWTVAHQAPLSMGFSRQEYWSGLPFPSPGDLPDPGIKPRSPASQADAFTSEPPGKPTTKKGILSPLLYSMNQSQVSDAIQPSHPLPFPSLPAPNPSQHQSLFQSVNSSQAGVSALVSFLPKKSQG